VGGELTFSLLPAPFGTLPATVLGCFGSENFAFSQDLKVLYYNFFTQECNARFGKRRDTACVSLEPYPSNNPNNYVLFS
jgi:hypothetical protein